MSKNLNKIIFLLFLALVVRTFIIFQGLETLIRNAVVLDDSFIVLSIARNMCSGKGFSFNGIGPTTGTTVLWTLLLSLFGSLSKPSLTLFSMFLSGCFFVISGLVLYLISKEILNEKTSILILLLFLFNPFFILISLNGLETSLFILLSLLTFFFYFKFVREKQISLTKLLFLNFILFLTVLTREEGYLVFAALLLDMLVLKRKKKLIIEFFLIFIVLIAPQFAIREYLFGNPLPSSLNALLKNPWLLKHGFIQHRIGVFVLNLSLVSAALGNILLAFLGIFLLKKQEIFGFRPLFLYGLLNLFFYSFVIPIGNFRYSFPISAILTIGLGSTFSFLQKVIENNIKSFPKIIFCAMLFLFLGLLSLSAFIIWTNVRYGGDGEILWANRDIYFYHVAQFLNENTQRNSRIVASHIGTLQYFLEDRIVLDAGGKVDYEAGNYFNDKEKYFDYFEKKNASYIVQILSPKQFESINKIDIMYFEAIYAKPNEPLAYLKGAKADYIENYIVVLRFKKDYLNFFLPS